MDLLGSPSSSRGWERGKAGWRGSKMEDGGWPDARREFALVQLRHSKGAPVESWFRLNAGWFPVASRLTFLVLCLLEDCCSTGWGGFNSFLSRMKQGNIVRYLLDEPGSSPLVGYSDSSGCRTVNMAIIESPQGTHENDGASGCSQREEYLRVPCYPPRPRLKSCP